MEEFRGGLRSCSANLFQKNKSELRGDSLTPEFGIAQFLVQPQIALTAVSREKFKAVNVRKQGLNLLHQLSANALILKIGMHDQSFNDARFLCHLGADGSDNYAVGTDIQEQAALHLCQ